MIVVNMVVNFKNDKCHIKREILDKKLKGAYHDDIVQSIYENYWHNLKQIATVFFSAGMHSGQMSLKHTKNPLCHLWGKQVKSPIKVTFSH